MVQFIQGSKDPREASYGYLAQALGEGLSKGVTSHFANKALDEVLSNEEYKDLPQSEKMGILEKSMRRFGQPGRDIIQNRLQTEKVAMQEKQEKMMNKHAEIVGKILNGQQVSEKERNSLPADISLAIAKHEQTGKIAQDKANNKSPLGGLGGQPIDPNIVQEIENVVTNNPDDNADQLAIKLSKAGVPTRNQTPYIENRRREIETNASLLEKGYKSQEAYLNDLTKSLSATDQMDQKLDRIAELKDVPEPLLYETMQTLGIPTAIFSAEGEELEKLSNDLTKNIQQFYGSRILQSEFQNFLKSIPTLKNSQEGRERIIENMKMFNNLKRLEYNTARGLELDYESKNKPLPPSFQRIVYDKMKPEAEKFSNEWKESQKSKIKSKNKQEPKVESQKEEMEPPQPGMKLYKDPSGETWWMTPEMVEQARAENVIFSE